VSPGFDGSGYRQRVLAVLQERSPLVLDDPFLVADLDPDAAVSASDADLRAHLKSVIAFLQRERNSAKYKTLAAELIRRREEWEGALLDPARRSAARDTALAGRRASDAERYGKVDGYLSTVRERFGGIPRSRVDGLRRLAAAAGVPAAEFDARLSRERVLDDGAGDGVEPLAAGVRRQIREQLAELDRLRGGDRAGTSSLWAFLGVPPGAEPIRLRAAYEMLGERNARRAHDREMTVTSDLLAQVRTRLIDGDPAAYTAGLVADAKDSVRARVEEHVVLDDGLNPVATEGLVREVLGFGLGLSAEQARSVVLDVARELGAAVTTGAAVDYVVCANCGRPEQAGGSRTCRYCGADLYVACPSCGRETEVAAIVCRHCGQNVRQAREVAEALARVGRALGAGRPREAADVLAGARALVEATGGAPAAQARELAARVQAALGAAEAGWRALTEDVAAHRVEAASDGARWLSTQASDVPGPDGRLPAAVVDELSALRDVVRRRVAAARGLPPDQRESALVAVLRTAADDREALADLAALPLAPVTDLTSTETDDAIVLRWRPSGSTAAEPVSYKVVRIVEEPVAGRPAQSERSLGTTRAVELSDAGVPAGVRVWHEVTATSGNRRAEPVRTSPTIVVRDVTALRAEMAHDGVALTWRLDAARDGVVIDRSIDSSSSVGGPTRRISASGGRYIDPDVQAGVTYRYHVRVEYAQVSGAVGRTPGAEVTISVTPRPRPVVDLEAETDGGVTTLRWSSIPGSAVRVYAATAGSAAAAAVPAVDTELPGGASGQAMAGIGRSVGESRRGRLTDSAGAGEVVYTPVTVSGDRAVVGRAVRHVVVDTVRDLRVDDRGDEIVLSFQMPPGITEARVLWRRDAPPAGPDDPAAASAKVTNTSLEIKGGWHLSAPADGWGYHVAVYPLVRTADGVRPLPAGTGVLARAATRAGEPPARVTGPRVPTGPIPVPHRSERASGSQRARTVPPVPPVPPPGPPPSPPPGPPPSGPLPLGPPPSGPLPLGPPPSGPPPSGQPPSGPLPSGPLQSGPLPLGQPPSGPGAGSSGGAPAGHPETSPPALRQVSASYALSRPGLRRRTLRVEVRADGPLPELVLVARTGDVPPRTPSDGRAIARIPAGPAGRPRTVDVPLGQAHLPWAVRLLPAGGQAAPGLALRHPDDADLVVR
jgi:hypothetical protein